MKEYQLIVEFGERNIPSALEEQKKEAFLETFNGIDAQFRAIFEKLSAGNGELHLEDMDDPFQEDLKPLQESGSFAEILSIRNSCLCFWSVSRS